MLHSVLGDLRQQPLYPPVGAPGAEFYELQRSWLPTHVHGLGYRDTRALRAGTAVTSNGTPKAGDAADNDYGSICARVGAVRERSYMESKLSEHVDELAACLSPMAVRRLLAEVLQP